MNIRNLGTVVLGLLVLAISAGALADQSRPTCAEEPGLRDCVKVEDPDAKPPKPSVYRKPEPAAPVAKPLPASGRPKAR